MRETSDRLAAVALDGQALPFSHGVLIHAMHGWHVALYQVPTYACPAVRKDGRVVVETVAGNRLTGHAVTEFVTQGGGYVLLSGSGRLNQESPPQGTSLSGTRVRRGARHRRPFALHLRPPTALRS
jgi:hypothetical protein